MVMNNRFRHRVTGGWNGRKELLREAAKLGPKIYLLDVLKYQRDQTFYLKDSKASDGSTVQVSVEA